MIKLLIISFLKSKTSRIGLLALFFAGLVGLHFGKLFLDESQENISKAAQLQKEDIARHVKFEQDDLGLLLYYTKFGLINEMPPLAGLSIGQRDVYPSIQRVNIRNLEEQKYNSRLANPVYQLIGNFDLSFVLIYFAPLVIIAFCYNIVSEEKENGTWELALSQSGNIRPMIYAKFFIRYVSILLVIGLLWLISLLYLRIPFNQNYLAYGLISLGYISFWFAVVWLVTSFHFTSSKNALYLLTIWVVFNIIAPAAINGVISLLYPVPESFATALQSREGYHNKWDQDKAPTIQKFVKHYPQFKEYTHLEGAQFSWFWYYAMQQMGDDEAAQKSAELKNKLKQRASLGDILGMFFPGIHTQLTFNHLAKTGLHNRLHFMQALEEFHEQKRLYFYPKIFSKTPVLNENWGKYTLVRSHQPLTIGWLSLLLPFGLFIFLCLLGSRPNMKKFYRL